MDRPIHWWVDTYLPPDIREQFYEDAKVSPLGGLTKLVPSLDRALLLCFRWDDVDYPWDRLHFHIQNGNLYSQPWEPTTKEPDHKENPFRGW